MTAVLAAPAMPRYGINEQTKECSQFFMGDECSVCSMPEGWQNIDDQICPEGYKEVNTNSVCKRNKVDHCCTAGHTGGNGDCEDVVINEAEKKCAFVEDINKCKKLPTNWKQAEVVDFWGKSCPSYKYQWSEEVLDCDTLDNTFNKNFQQTQVIEKLSINKNLLYLGLGIFIIAFIVIIILFIKKLFTKNNKPDNQ